MIVLKFYSSSFIGSS